MKTTLEKLRSRPGFTRNVIILAIILTAFIMLPQFGSEYVIYVTILAMLYAVLTGSYDVITGYTGVAFPLSGIIVFIFAAIVGYPALRLKGHYFAVTTFFLGHFIYLVILNSVNITNGPMGLRGIKPPEGFLGIDFNSMTASYYLIFIYSVVAIILLFLLVRSGVGKLFVSIRENEELSEAIGVNTAFYKVLAFSISAGVAGLTGSLFAHFFRLLHPTTFAWMTSEMVVIMALVGGMGTLIGPIIGAGIVTLILELMRFAPELRFIIWSAALIVILIIEPRGLMGIFKRIQGGKK